MNFLSLIVAMAIAGILAAISIPNIGSMANESQTAQAQRDVHAAWSLLASSAVADDGATLTYVGRTLTVTAGTSSVQWTLPANTQISLNGNPFTCLGLNGDGIPAVTSLCSSQVIPATSIPSFYLSVHGGPYVPPVS